mgnify:CR=1 FL=1
MGENHDQIFQLSRSRLSQQGGPATYITTALDNLISRVSSPPWAMPLLP